MAKSGVRRKKQSAKAKSQKINVSGAGYKVGGKVSAAKKAARRP